MSLSDKCKMISWNQFEDVINSIIEGKSISKDNLFKYFFGNISHDRWKLFKGWEELDDIDILSNTIIIGEKGNCLYIFSYDGAYTNIALSELI